MRFCTFLFHLCVRKRCSLKEKKSWKILPLIGESLDFGFYFFNQPLKALLEQFYISSAGDKHCFKQHLLDFLSFFIQEDCNIYFSNLFEKNAGKNLKGPKTS